MKKNLAGLAFMWIAIFTTSLSAEDLQLSIERPSQLDRQYMRQQRESLSDLALRHLGRDFTGQRNNDVALLQSLLDKKLVRNEQKKELQAMGIVLGDLLAAELDMDWVIYIDKVGRSRALRYRETDNFLFPATMISRRREVNNLTPIVEIYEQARQTGARGIPALPFQ